MTTIIRSALVGALLAACPVFAATTFGITTNSQKIGDNSNGMGVYGIGSHCLVLNGTTIYVVYTSETRQTDAFGNAVSYREVRLGVSPDGGTTLNHPLI
ncbi:MAG TPA: hypothetical protein VF912_09620 [Anaeromyxobacter sp.]